MMKIISLSLCLLFLFSSLASCEILVCDFANDSILRYTDQGEFIDEFVPGDTGILDGPYRVIQGPDGSIYVISLGNDSILRYAYPSGQFLGNFTLGGSLNNPFNLRFGPDGNLYVLDNTGALKKFDGRSGVFIENVISVLGSARMRFEKTTGDLFVINRSTSSLDLVRVEFDFEADEAAKVVFSGNIDGNLVSGLDFGPGGDLYLHLSDSGTSRVHRLDLDSLQFLQIFVFNPPPPNGPIEFAPTGELLIANYLEDRIERYDPVTGLFIDTLIDELPNDPVDFAFVGGVVLGDINGDGCVDLLDVQAFVDLLVNGGFQEEADINGDGVVDLLDVEGFIDLLVG